MTAEPPRESHRNIQLRSERSIIGGCLQVASIATSVLLSGCASQWSRRDTAIPVPPLALHDHRPPPDIDAIYPASAEDVRHLAMFTGDGAVADWNDLLQAAAWADVIIIGEEHDDGIGHGVQLALLQDVLQRWPRAALSMEMLERDDQPLVDDYLDDLISAEDLARLTFSQNWGGRGRWPEWYQPMIDAAKASGTDVIAANAPRRYVRIARLHGYRKLRSLPQDRRRLFDLPLPLLDDAYRQRFLGLMSEDESHGGADAADASFRSQLLWDATMAASIAAALKASAPKVVHVVGKFHSDFEGGTVQQLRRRQPQARILTISMNREQSPNLLDDDRGRAHFVVYTGRPEQPQNEEGQTDDEAIIDTKPTDVVPAEVPAADSPSRAAASPPRVSPTVWHLVRSTHEPNGSRECQQP